MPSRRVAVPLAVGIGHAVVDRHHHLGRRAPGDLRLDLPRRRTRASRRTSRPDRCRSVRQYSTARVHMSPVGANGRPLQVFDRVLVDGDHAGARAGLDRHVAHRHAAFHRQRADRLAGEFDRMSGAAGGADPADDRQHDVLRRHARPAAHRRRGPASSSSSCAAGTASRARARPRRCRCRTPARANAPCVLVCESPHTTVMPGSVAPCSGPMTCTMPWRLSRNGK